MIQVIALQRQCYGGKWILAGQQFEDLTKNRIL